MREEATDAARENVVRILSLVGSTTSTDGATICKIWAAIYSCYDMACYFTFSYPQMSLVTFAILLIVKALLSIPISIHASPAINAYHALALNQWHSNRILRSK